MTIRTLKSMRADRNFAMFCKDVTALAEPNRVNAPVLPRRRSLPVRYEDGNAPAEFDETPESRYRHSYFEALDKWTMYITDRFGQHDYMFLHELNFIKLFRCDLTTEVNNGRRTTFKN